MARKKVTSTQRPTGPNGFGVALMMRSKCFKLYGNYCYDAVLAHTAAKRAKTGRYMPAGVISALRRMRKDEARLRQTEPKNCGEPVPE